MSTTINGLTLQSIRTDIPFQGRVIDFKEDLVKWIKIPSMVVAYLDYSVLIGKYENKEFVFSEGEQFDLQYLLKIRVFNKNEEFHVWRSNGKLFGRVRCDKQGKECDVVEAFQVLWGTKNENKILDNFTQITEERGAVLTLPGKWQVNKYKERVAIRTLNYIRYFTDENRNTNGSFIVPQQATYADCRFVEIVQHPIEF